VKAAVERRSAFGYRDHFALAVTTFGVGYLPLAPGTWGSAVGVLIYLLIEVLVIGTYASLQTGLNAYLDTGYRDYMAWVHAILLILFLLFTLLGVWAAGRATELLGNTDPPEAVIDEIIGQLIVFLFVPFSIGWPMILAGFLLFRLFDVWKPYPIDYLQVLPGGIGVCADDILAGVYAGVCLSVIYAISLSL
jgi:phosphatidylglycerophosphatase A